MIDDFDDAGPCATLQDELTELSLGILTGRARSQVLHHVEHCSRCSAALDHLSITADTLLQLAPSAEPPLGFELRLADRLGAKIGPRRIRPVRGMKLLAVAAVIAIALGFGIGALTAGSGGRSQGRLGSAGLTSAILRSHGHAVGEVMVSPGSPTWIFMSVEGGHWTGPVTCTVTLAGGKTETIGVFKLARGYGAWGAPLGGSASSVRSAQLTAANGTVLARAQLRV